MTLIDRVQLIEMTTKPASRLDSRANDTSMLRKLIASPPSKNGGRGSAARPASNLPTVLILPEKFFLN